MPKLICVKCQCELKPETNETTVVETAFLRASASPDPYKVWHADTWKCPGCGVEVVAGFGIKPVLEYFHEGFEEALENTLHEARRVVYDHERPTPCP